MDMTMMKRLLCVLCAALMMLTAIGLERPAQAASNKKITVSFSADTYQNRARSVLKSLNAYRKKNGLPELQTAADIDKAAIQRGAEIFVLYDHSRPDMTDFNTVCNDYASLKGYGYCTELIGAGYSKADEIWADWLENAEDVILDEDYTHVGISCVYVKGSENEYYWCALFIQAPDNFKGKAADSTVKAGKTQTMKVTVSSDMFSHADNTHRKFELRVSDVNMKTKSTATPTVSLYDRYDVKIGKVELSDSLNFKSGNTKVFTVDKQGNIKRVKAGTATLTVKFTNLDEATATVTVGSGSSSGSTSTGSSGSTSGSVTATTIKDAVPALTAREYTKYTTLSVQLKGASGYVLYRSTSKTGTYTKVDEEATTSKWSVKIMHEDLNRTYYYKVRAYKNSNGKRVYSEYSDPVRIAP